MGRPSDRRLLSDTNSGSPGPGGGCGSRCVVCESGAVVRPVELGHALQVWPRFSAQRWYRPNADVAAARSVLLANPKGDERFIGREPQGADRWIDEFRRAPVGQVVG